MNDLVKNLLITLAVGLVLMTVFQTFSPAFAPSTPEVTYSSFLSEVDANKVKKVEFTDGSSGGITVLNYERADGTKVKVLVGSFDGVRGPVTDVATDPLYLDITLPAGVKASVPVAAEHNAFGYVFEGTARIGSEAQLVDRGELAVLSLGDGVTVEGGPKGGRLILVAGRPLREPVAKYGPFVMNTPAEIHQAIADYQAGKFV